ncbi:group 1 glycosyl transferase [Flammeovirgaceae bacterium 311]|nr:group 1 glycosyl transferase [Flammeovirgaceae bacterium 311]
MNVLHICDDFSPVSQTFIYDVLIQLNLIGISNHVVADAIVNQGERPFNNVYSLLYPKKSFLEKLYLKILNKLIPNWEKYIKDKYYNKKKIFDSYLRKIKPHLIHAHFGPQGIFALPCAMKYNIPLIVSFHGFDAFKLPTDLNYRTELMKVFDYASCITVVSELMKLQLINLGCPVEKLRVIHVGKNMKEYIFRPKKKFSTIKKFITIGRLVEKKGFDDCIEAFKYLVIKYPDISLTIIGEGELYNSLIQLIKDNNISNNVKLIGRLSHSESMKVLKEADAFILCSKTAKDGDMEGIPTVLMEAQSLGIPCISTFHSGIPEVIPVQNHWMLATESCTKNISEVVEKVVNAPAEKLESAVIEARRLIEEAFNLETEVNKLLDIYHSITTRNRHNENINN